MGFVACDCEGGDKSQAGADTARERLVGTRTGQAVPCRAVGLREREGSKGHPRVPCIPGDSRVAFFRERHICLSNFPLPKPAKRAQNALRSQKHSSRAVLGNSRPGQLSLPAAVWGHWGHSLSCWGCWMLPACPWACAQQHLGVLRVKVEEGLETFVQLAQHLIWECSRGEVNTGNAAEPTLVSGAISASGQGRYLPLLQTTRLSHKVHSQI